jgi:hypothetical protein
VSAREADAILAVALRNCVHQEPPAWWVWGSGAAHEQITEQQGGAHRAVQVADLLRGGGWDGVCHQDVWIEGPDGERLEVP